MKPNNFIRDSDFLGFLKKHLVLSVLFVGIPIILGFGYLYVNSSFKLLDFLQRRNKEYTMVEPKDNIDGIILSVYSDRGGSFVEFKDSSKMWFEVSAKKNMIDICYVIFCSPMTP